MIQVRTIKMCFETNILIRIVVCATFETDDFSASSFIFSQREKTIDECQRKTLKMSKDNTVFQYMNL